MGAADGVAAVLDKRDWPLQPQTRLGHSFCKMIFKISISMI